jgi:hypothetical protein
LNQGRSAFALALAALASAFAFFSSDTVFPQSN